MVIDNVVIVVIADFVIIVIIPTIAVGPQSAKRTPLFYSSRP